MSGFSPSGRGYSPPRELDDEESSSFLNAFRPFGVEDLQKEKPARRGIVFGLSRPILGDDAPLHHAPVGPPHNPIAYHHIHSLIASCMPLLNPCPTSGGAALCVILLVLGLGLGLGLRHRGGGDTWVACPAGLQLNHEEDLVFYVVRNA